MVTLDYACEEAHKLGGHGTVPSYRSVLNLHRKCASRAIGGWLANELLEMALSSQWCVDS